MAVRQIFYCKDSTFILNNATLLTRNFGEIFKNATTHIYKAEKFLQLFFAIKAYLLIFWGMVGGSPRFFTSLGLAQWFGARSIYAYLYWTKKPF